MLQLLEGDKYFWISSFAKFIFSFLLILCLFLSVTPVMADSAWNLALDGRILGGVPVRDNGRMTMVSIGVMGRLLQLKLEHKDDTLLTAAC